MRSSIFGWSLPPGCTNQMIEDAMGVDQPCEVCGQFPDDCICPECKVCGGQGDPTCYRDHGMEKSDEQIESLKAAEAEWEHDARIDDLRDTYGMEDFKERS